MIEYVYYIDFDNCIHLSYVGKLYWKVFTKCVEKKIDGNKKLILINRRSLNKRIIKKITKCIQLSKSKIIISKSIIESCCFDNELYLDGKIIFKNMILNVIEYLKEVIGNDIREETIHVAIDNDENIKYIYDIGYQFRSINIVTRKIQKLERLEKKLQLDDNIVFCISNNKKKSLKRAKIIINFDYDDSFFEQFCINRNCIIINLNRHYLNMKNSFHGNIIEGIRVDYINSNYSDLINKENFDNTLLYESFMYNMDYNGIKNMVKKDKCRIKSVYGSKAVISGKELKNNFIKSSIKLDKNKKKD